ncbi:MAG: alpha/beta hydrolase [candidate division Zixibacteria bacterium]
MLRLIKYTVLFEIIILFACNISSLGSNASSINSLEEVNLGGTNQWILMRSDNLNNPILLFLHGGPGYPEMPYTHFDSPRLEKHFIVVNWDQRGAGKSFNDSVDVNTLNLEQFLSDTHELIQFLRKRFSKDKLFLIGQSWGTILGLYTAERYPELIHAYIGMGQVVNSTEGETLSYQYTLEKAKEGADSEAVAALENIGPPPYSGGFGSLAAQRQYLTKYGGAMINITYPDLMKIMSQSPHYTKIDKQNFMKAFIQTNSIMWNEVMEVNFSETLNEIRVPVYFFTGKYDFVTPFEIVERFFAKLKAPNKKMIWFDNSGHWPNLDEPEKYQDELIKIVRNVMEK